MLLSYSLFVSYYREEQQLSVFLTEKRENFYEKTHDVCVEKDLLKKTYRRSLRKNSRYIRVILDPGVLQVEHEFLPPLLV